MYVGHGLIVCCSTKSIMALSIAYWANYTCGKVKMVKKSESAVNSDHVLKFLYDAETDHVTAVVQASYRDASYNVKVNY